jgi:hypothetical protein
VNGLSLRPKKSAYKVSEAIPIRDITRHSYRAEGSTEPSNTNPPTP